MATAFLVGEFDFILEADRELSPEHQTIFRLKILSRRQLEEMSESSGYEDKQGNVHYRVNGEEKCRKLLNAGLVGWKNLPDPDGKQVEFRAVEEGGRRIIPEEILEYIRPYRIELANAISEGTRVSEQTAKNSSSR